MTQTTMTIESARQTVAALLPGTDVSAMNAEELKEVVQGAIAADERDAMSQKLLEGILEDLNREFPLLH